MIVDDDPGVAAGLYELIFEVVRGDLMVSDTEIMTATSWERAYHIIKRKGVDLLIIDIDTAERGNMDFTFFPNCSVA